MLLECSRRTAVEQNRSASAEFKPMALRWNRPEEQRRPRKNTRPARRYVPSRRLKWFPHNSEPYRSLLRTNCLNSSRSSLGGGCSLQGLRLGVRYACLQMEEILKMFRVALAARARVCGTKLRCSSTSMPRDFMMCFLGRPANESGRSSVVGKRTMTDDFSWLMGKPNFSNVAMITRIRCGST